MLRKTNNGNTHDGYQVQQQGKVCDLHRIISEGVHKVEDIEEDVNSLFLALMNPEDKQNISDTQSFSDRITNIKIPYVLDYNTEVKIYRNVSETISSAISFRGSSTIWQRSSYPPGSAPGRQAWRSGSRSGEVPALLRPESALAQDGHLTGLIPSWLSDEDRKNFTAKRRRRIIAESETEGDKGFTGRDSIKIFSDFYSAYAKKGKIITMAMVCGFFNQSGTAQEDSYRTASSIPSCVSTITRSSRR